MASGGQIDIKVNFVGLDDLDRIMQEVGQGATRVGQQVGQVGRSFDDLLDDGVEGLEDLREGIEGLGEGLGDLNEEYEQNNNRQKENQKENKKSISLMDTLSSSLGQAGSAFGTMGDASSQALGGVVSTSAGAVSSLGALATSAKTTGASIGTMLGPIGLVALGVFELVKAFREFSDTQDKVQARVDAYKASLSEMTAVLETLATKQVDVSEEEIERLQELNNQGKIRIEDAQELRATSAKLYAEMIRAENRMRDLREQRAKIEADPKAQQAQFQIAQINRELESTSRKHLGLKEQIAKVDKQAIKIAKEGYPFRKKFEEELLKLEQRSPILRKQQAEQEASFILQLEAVKNKSVVQGVETRKRALDLEYMSRVAQLDKMVFTEQEQYLRAKQLIEEIHTSQLETLEKQEKKMARARYRARAEARKREQEARLKEEQARVQSMLALNAQINQNNIRLTKEGFDQERALIESQYNEQLRLAQDNAQQLILAQQNYQLALNALNEKQEKAEIDAFLKRRDRLNKQNDEEIKMAIEKQEAIRKAQDDIIQGAFDTAKAMGQSALASTASALASGESMEKVLKDQLKAISIEATVQSALESAKALGELASGNIAGATAHGKSALAFAGVATLAGVLSKGGGATSGGGGGASPTGAPQVSSPEREEFREQSQQMVFNISMGTVYSTEQSALTALTSAITREQNRHRRGAPRNA
jgi:hypothetical protein